jgi:hypothetical protein
MKPLRISIDDLAPRESAVTEAIVQEKLKSLGADEGAPCERTCDCRIGLVCRDKVCVQDW